MPLCNERIELSLRSLRIEGGDYVNWDVGWK